MRNSIAEVARLGTYYILWVLSQRRKKVNKNKINSQVHLAALVISFHFPLTKIYIMMRRCGEFLQANIFVWKKKKVKKLFGDALLIIRVVFHILFISIY